MPETIPHGFWAKFRHAFAIDAPPEGITAEEDTLLAKVADAVVRRRMTLPATMFLESVRPLSFLGSQALVFFQPILGLIMNPAEIEKFSKLLEKRPSVQRLIEQIEEAERKR